MLERCRDAVPRLGSVEFVRRLASFVAVVMYYKGVFFGCYTLYSIAPLDWYLVRLRK